MSTGGISTGIWSDAIGMVAVYSLCFVQGMYEDLSRLVITKIERQFYTTRSFLSQQKPSRMNKSEDTVLKSGAGLLWVHV